MQECSETEFIKAVFEAHRQMMFKTALGILHNESDAEDAVQNAFLWIIRHLEKITQIPPPERALYFTYITEHISIDLCRKQKSHPTDNIDEAFDLGSAQSVEDEVLSRLAVGELKSALEELSDRDYDLLYLRLFKEKGYGEIGEIMGIPENYVRVYVQRARKRFIKILKKRGVIDDV